MAGRMKPWLASWRKIDTRMVIGGSTVVTVTVVVTTPGSSAGREIEIELTPTMARHLADRLERNALEADEHNDRRPGAKNSSRCGAVPPDDNATCGLLSGHDGQHWSDDLNIDPW